MQNSSDSSSDRVPVPSDGQALVLRVVYMLVFGVVFWILCWTLAVTAVLQLVLRLLNGQPHADIQRFGASLALYTKQVIEYLTFASERLPFPFSEWPTVAQQPSP